MHTKHIQYKINKYKITVLYFLKARSFQNVLYFSYALRYIRIAYIEF